MSGAQILTIGGTASALVMTCGFSKTAGAIMLAANVATIIVERVKR